MIRIAADLMNELLCVTTLSGGCLYTFILVTCAMVRGSSFVAVVMEFGWHIAIVHSVMMAATITLNCGALAASIVDDTIAADQPSVARTRRASAKAAA